MDKTEDQRPNLLASMTQIVTAHLANTNTSLPTENIPAFMRDVYTTIRSLENGSEETGKDTPVSEAQKPKPAVDVELSVFPEYIVCLEDGKHLKMLKRHLMSRYQMTPDQYRQKWSLPKDYPMVAPAYAERRAAVAREIGLGRRITTQVPDAPPERVEDTPPPAEAATSTAAASVEPSRASKTRQPRSTPVTSVEADGIQKKKSTPKSPTARARKSKSATS
ncbi:MAG: MucR family transcriptional regulator [Gluconobacter potus]|uniref:MucR family transcriptional regulator n=1 Tax=Acetobacteraceae TaxID=433 RepID=UPI00296EBB46|nr:MucR family transcriptional regulator [Komagataeibacter rhaeticus]